MQLCRYLGMLVCRCPNSSVWLMCPSKYQTRYIIASPWTFPFCQFSLAEFSRVRYAQKSEDLPKLNFCGIRGSRMMHKAERFGSEAAFNFTLEDPARRWDASCSDHIGIQRCCLSSKGGNRERRNESFNIL